MLRLVKELVSSQAVHEVFLEFALENSDSWNPQSADAIKHSKFVVEKFRACFEGAFVLGSVGKSE